MRMGGKRRPFYRIVVAEKRSKRDGKCIDVIGHYDPLREPAAVTIDRERLNDWLAHGAQPTETVRRLIKRVSN